MYTTDDILFCILESCVDGLESSKLIYYMYVFQMAGFKFSFRYRINASGLACKQLNECLDSLVNDDKVKVIDGVVKLTKSGEFYYDNVVLTASEWDKVNMIKSVLDTMNERELFFICITDMTVYDVLKTYGVDGLIKQREKIQSMISVLSKEYTDENFDTALKFIRIIKEK